MQFGEIKRKPHKSFETITITGRILPDKTDEDEENETEEDSVENDDFLDYDDNKAASTGAIIHIRSQRCPSKKVIIKDDRGKEYRVLGNFLFSDPFWTVTVTIKRYIRQTSDIWYLCHGSKYFLYDRHLDSSTIHIFLTKCGVEKDEKRNRKDFTKLLVPDEDDVTFDTIIGVARDLNKRPGKRRDSKEGKHESARVVATRILRSDCGQMVIWAKKFPKLFEFLPVLLPDYVWKLLYKDRSAKTNPEDKQHSDEKHERILKQLHDVLTNEPWKFAFRKAIYKECDIFIGESTKKRFEQAELYDEEHMERKYLRAIHIYDAMKTRGDKRGHTCGVQKDLRKQYGKDLGTITNEEWDALKDILEKNDAVKFTEIKKIKKMFLYNMFKKETDIAEGLQYLRSNGQPLTYDLNMNLDGMDKKQEEAAQSIKNNPLTIVSGKGGTGKTTVVSRAVANLPHDKVALTAPTGKAASNLKKACKGTGHESCTLHHLTASFYHWESKKKQKISNGNCSDAVKEADEWKYSKTEIWVVDECSLVPIGIFADVLKIFQAKANLKRVVLLGDHHQLPSVQPGNLLEDIINYLKEKGLKEETEEWIKQLPSSSGDIADQRLSQFITHTRDDCAKINKWCLSKYSDHSQPSFRSKFEKGDKICARRNASIRHVGRSDTFRIQNGEIWFIKEIEESGDSRGRDDTRVTLEDASGESEVITYMVDLQREARICHAWAQTIHKFQGSEEDTIFFIIGDTFMDRKHVYTAVTRAKKRVYIIGTKAALMKAIKKNPAKRETGLKDFLMLNDRKRLSLLTNTSDQGLRVEACEYVPENKKQKL